MINARPMQYERGSGFTAQAHLEWDPKYSSKYDSELLERERVASHAKEVPPEGQRGYPDVYVNGADVDAVTVTIDPLKNAHWIRDDSHAHRHAATQQRGALKDHAGVMKALSIVSQAPSLETTFIPTSDMLDALDKLTPRCVQNSTRGYRGAPASGTYGKLPTISKRIWDGVYRDVPDWKVTRDVVMESTHASRDRSYDCSGGGWVCR